MTDDTTLNSSTSDHGQVIGIARTLDRFSGETRERRRRRKLREELVRDHILGGAGRRRGFIPAWLTRWWR